MGKGYLSFCLATVLGALSVGGMIAAEPLSSGASTIHRQSVEMALHIPPTLEGAHGPAGVLIFFGGSQDSTAYYQKAFTSVADALDLVVIIPQMQWFKEPGKIPPRGVYGALKQTVAEVEKQFQTDPRMVIIGGASAGGGSAHELTKEWSQKVPLFLLASTGPFPDIAKPRTFHVVADKEVSRLGPQGRTGSMLGRGKKDLFAVPGGEHSAQIKHLTVWLETEVSVLRLEKAQETIRLAEAKLRSRERDQARLILASTLAAVRILDQPVSEGDDYFKYETKRRQELKEKYASVIKTIEATDAKLAEAANSVAAAP